ncbi:MAG: dienelactone hydrolase family protein [Proteobacteria bacterium]|nr:dienelactone hydrolase family protein [Pseudomonadota bacterium]
MSSLAKISGPERAPAKGGDARQLVVFLHGWGADGNDLIGLAEPWSEALPHAHFMSPHAPDVCDANPAGRQWFSFDNRSAEEITNAAAEAAPIINRFIEHGLERLALSDSHLALVGFSQGAMLAIYVALRRAAPCAAVVGYSGALIGAETLAAEIRSRPPILLAHGDADPVVPFASLDAAIQMLGSHDVPVRWHAGQGLGHGIDGPGLELGGEFIADAFAAG